MKGTDHSNTMKTEHRDVSRKASVEFNASRSLPLLGAEYLARIYPTEGANVPLEPLPGANHSPPFRDISLHLHLCMDSASAVVGNISSKAVAFRTPCFGAKGVEFL